MNDDFSAPEIRRRNQVSRFALALAALAVLVSLLWLWDRLRNVEAREELLRERIDVLVQREDALSAQTQTLRQDVSALSGVQGGLSQRLDALYGARRAGLLAAEAEYLTRLAAQRLALAHDASGALTLLLAADAALADIRDTGVHAARTTLATDIARLRQLAAVDVEAVYLRLAALPPQVDRISERQLQAPAPATLALPAAAAAEEGWLARLGAELRTLVNIRRVDAPLAPLVTRGEKELAAQNFRLLVEQAQIALLQRQGPVYRHSLVQAGDWLERIASGDPVLRNAVRRELASLQTVAPDTSLPDLGASLAATRALATRLVPETTP